MHNWSVDAKELKKHKNQFILWRLEQMINYGTDGRKIKASELRRHWRQLTLDPAKRRFLSFLLWGEKFLTKGK